MNLSPIYVRDKIREFINEDTGDHGSTYPLGVLPRACANFKAQENVIICGAELVPVFFESYLSGDGHWESNTYKDGLAILSGQSFATVEADAAAIIQLARPILNLVAHLSGIATHTKRLVDQLHPDRCSTVGLRDTRKTTPGLRAFEKHAVVVGGGRNHRFARFDGAIIKKEDIAILGGISAALSWARQHHPSFCKIAVEVENRDQLQEVLGQYEGTVDVANTGVDAISLSALITGAPKAKMNMIIEKL